MTEVVVAAYEKGSNMNLEYYLKNHVPMVFGFWQPFAKSWRVEMPSPDSDSPYELIVFVEMDNIGDFAKACTALSEDQNKRMEDDLKNYTQRPPIFWTQERKGSGKA